mmetsp:Transcript_58354/g.187456  ORF Transcript_58354/g.187456 Transcript_58354/m.187456 type:complete len:205 (+) Transcript_58354:654-1268(+)
MSGTSCEPRLDSRYLIGANRRQVAGDVGYCPVAGKASVDHGPHLQLILWLAALSSLGTGVGLQQRPRDVSRAAGARDSRPRRRRHGLLRWLLALPRPWWSLHRGAGQGRDGYGRVVLEALAVPTRPGAADAVGHRASVRPAVADVPSGGREAPLPDIAAADAPLPGAAGVKPEVAAVLPPQRLAIGHIVVHEQVLTLARALAIR